MMAAGPLPLVVGITGHRDLRDQDHEALASSIRALFADLRRRYEATPLVLLSPLAEGADRLAARVALEEGVRLVVPLPLPLPLYETDFGASGSLDEFHSLLARADTHFEAPLPEGCVGGDVAAPGPARDQRYEHVGAYVVRHCQILLALWDGDETELAGGTAQMVRFQLRGVPEPFAPARGPLDEADTGPVYHVVTPRLKHPDPVGQPFSVRLLVPEGDALDDTAGDEARELGRVLTRADTFNRDACRLAGWIAGVRRGSETQLAGDRDVAGLAPSLRSTLDLFVQADNLANYYKGRSSRTLVLLFVVAFLAIVALHTYAELLRTPLLLGLYLLLLGGAYVWYMWAGDVPEPPDFLVSLLGTDRAERAWARRGDYRGKYLDYRALAEGMRVQFFWRLAGVHDSVADHYLRKQRSELDWIRNAARVSEIPGAAAAGRPAGELAPRPDPEFVLSQWVDDQRDFFARATGRDRRAMHRKERAVLALFALGLLATLVLLLVPLVEELMLELLHEYEESSHFVEELIVVLAGLAPITAGLREGYAEKQALSEEAKQYQQMGQLFSRASVLWRDALSAGRLADLPRLACALGEEALAENGDWVMLQRARPMQVPK